LKYIKTTYHFEDLGKRKIIILKWILNVIECGQDSTQGKKGKGKYVPRQAEVAQGVPVS
jgi:hypothetical protein